MFKYEIVWSDTKLDIWGEEVIEAKNKHTAEEALLDKIFDTFGSFYEDLEIEFKKRVNKNGDELVFNKWGKNYLVSAKEIAAGQAWFDEQAKIDELLDKSREAKHSR